MAGRAKHDAHPELHGRRAHGHDHEREEPDPEGAEDGAPGGVALHERVEQHRRELREQQDPRGVPEGGLQHARERSPRLGRQPGATGGVSSPAMPGPTDIRPPFTAATAAAQGAGRAEDAWNTRDPDRVVLAYTEDTEWRNRDEFLDGRDEIREFLRRKWAREQGYRLKKSLWAFTENRIAVRFEYESHDEQGQWWRSYGNENWEFDESGLMAKRYASINDVKIDASERRIAVD